MKSIILKLWIVIAVTLVFVSPLSAAYVTLTNSSISPTPLNETGIIIFGIVETSNKAAPATNTFNEVNIKMSADLNHLKLKDDSIAGITGTLLKYFTVKYNITEHKIIFIQKEDFPGFGDAKVSIPVDVTQTTISTDKDLNGFYVNISASDANTTADTGTSAYTYTK